MKKTLLISIICFISTVLLASVPVSQLRDLYFGARDQKGKLAYYQAALKADESDPLQCGYKGVAIASYAELADGVSAKFSYFEQGKNLLEKAIKASPNNPELRFLRFSVQDNVPWIVNYSDQLEEDAALVMQAIRQKKVNSKDAFWSKAIRFLLNSDEISSSEKKELKQYL
jgi:hypothetical protein